MRSIFYSLLSLATIATTLAVPDNAATAAKRAGADDDWEEKTPDTIFNGQTVPPMPVLDSKTLDKEIGKGNWLVEFFSPSCPHCTHFAPTYQTAYEFYYTSKPIEGKNEPEGDSLNSFKRFYDFNFAKVDCIASADLCAANNVMSYPSMIYFRDGKEVERQRGAKDMKELSTWVENLLETIRPGSRKEGGPKLPKAGDKAVEVGPDTEEVVKEKAKDEVKVKEAISSKLESLKNVPTKLAFPTEATPTKATPAKAVSTFNPSGISEPLTAEKFQTAITNTLDPWFVKFYAPWCHHCQALKPNWDNMARQMKGKLNIGEVNCDVEKRLCKDAKVRGYPTMLFFRGGERIEYEGLRGLGDLLDYANKATSVGAGVQDVDAASFKALEEKEEVVFVYFYDHATTSEDFMALERLTLSLVGKAKIVKTNDKAMSERFKISTWPRLMVSRDGKPTYYPPITPKEMRDTRQVLTWMKSVWLPLVPELTSSNAKDIMDGKIVVLGILSRDRSDEFILSKREMKTAAIEWIDKQDALFQLERQELRQSKQLRIEEAEDRGNERALRDAKGIRINMDDIERPRVGFAWVDGVFWERWVKTTYGIDVKEGERVIINDEDNRRFWDTTISGEPIRPSRTSILETIGKVTQNPPQIRAKSSTGRVAGFFLRLNNFAWHHPVLAVFATIGLIITALLGGKKMRRRGNAGYFQLSEKDGLLGGIGSGNGGAKHD
jgi:protein disulfide-isomerase